MTTLQQPVLFPEDVEWIVNDYGELGVKIQGQCFFLYRGKSFEYGDAKHPDDSPIRYRKVGQLEFGEGPRPDGWKPRDEYDLFTEPVPDRNERDNPEYQWQQMRPAPKAERVFQC